MALFKKKTAPSGVDTTANAAATPDKQQPWKELGLKEDEYARIREILGRRPTSAELAMYSVMWSEHCSYKSSKIYLRQFGEKVTDEMKKHLMVGMGENAGVVDIGEGWAVTFKVESHNHPSYIEPFQGAATGVGGIVRDILTMGARPIAVMDQLRFGAVENPDTARVVHGVVSGISFYGNCLGLPNIGGETVFDRVYQGNPLNSPAVWLGAGASADALATLGEYGADKVYVADSADLDDYLVAPKAEVLARVLADSQAAARDLLGDQRRLGDGQRGRQVGRRGRPRLVGPVVVAERVVGLVDAGHVLRGRVLGEPALLVAVDPGGVELERRTAVVVARVGQLQGERRRPGALHQSGAAA